MKPLKQSIFSILILLALTLSALAYAGARPAQAAPGTGWNTFLGDSAYDHGNAIAVDASGNIYVAGVSASTWGNPVNAYSASNDAFVAKLSPSGALLWNTFLGGSAADYAYGVTVDANGNLYVTGSSADTWGSPLNAYSAGDDAFVARLNSSDGQLTWNTFLGSSAGCEREYLRYWQQQWQLG